MQPNLFVLLGPTGIGKTDLSIELAQILESPIVSSDSRQIYKEMSIGTAVPSAELRRKIPHYFVQNKSIKEYYSAGIYEIEVLQLLEELFKNKNNILLVGGSGMYIDAVCKGIDPLPDINPEIRNDLIKKHETEGIESLRFDLKKIDPVSYSRIDLRNPKRILKALEVSIQTGKPYSKFLTKPKKKRPFNIIKIGIERPREEIYERINLRTDKMMQAGLEEEARRLYPYRKLNALNTVGYKELFAYFDRKIDKNEAVRLIKRDTRRYAKRQITWFKRNTEIRWFNPDNKEGIFNFVKKCL